MDLSKYKMRVIGRITVDAGIVWIGDPCYVLHTTPPVNIGQSWSEFCDIFGANAIKSFNHNMGHEGLGVCACTPDGDGTYPVIGIFRPGKTRPSAIIVNFNLNMNET